MNESVWALNRERYVGVAELAAAAAGLVGELIPAQERASVAEVPDERTVRYYLAEGLLSPASGKRGTASLYGYRQLLQLLTVKRLQADHLPIRKIKELLEGKTEEDRAGCSASAKRAQVARHLTTSSRCLRRRARRGRSLYSRSRGAPARPARRGSGSRLSRGSSCTSATTTARRPRRASRRRLARRLLEEINRRSGAPEE